MAFGGQSSVVDYTGSVSQIPTWKKVIVLLLARTAICPQLLLQSNAF